MFPTLSLILSLNDPIFLNSKAKSLDMTLDLFFSLNHWSQLAPLSCV